VKIDKYGLVTILANYPVSNFIYNNTIVQMGSDESLPDNLVLDKVEIVRIWDKGL
jgi:hypothetical protein